MLERKTVTTGNDHIALTGEEDKMKSSAISLSIVALVIICFSSVAGEPVTNPVPTFLDTLNKGKEVSLSDTDFSQQVTQPAAPQTAVPDTAHPTGTAVSRQDAGVVPSRFKIQILAGTQEQQVKKEKITLAVKVKIPLSISFETPYYKLFAGDFAQHSEAEAWCSQLKDMGYKDAWIVRTAASQKLR
jgi:hypothetical protein